MKKHFKHLLALLLAIVMTVLAGCGSIDALTEDAAYIETIVDALYEDGDTGLSEADTSDELLLIEDTAETEIETEAITAEETAAKTDAETAAETAAETFAEETASAQQLLDEDGSYNSKEDVALYIYQYGKLPSNYITKKEAEKLGWSGGSLEPYAPGKSIGGSRFGNYEGLLPEADGRTYTECDIDTKGKSKRGAKRIVFSNDGLIYYTEDHYESFELLYGEE